MKNNMKLRVFLSLCLASFLVIAGETPRIMVENIDSLATLKSPLDLCIQSSNFNKLDIKRMYRYLDKNVKKDIINSNDEYADDASI